MINNKLLILISAFWLYSAPIHAAIGCMNNSYNNSQSVDYKNYHYVQCNCPCGVNSRYAILPYRGKCRECQHYRNLSPMKIIRGSIAQPLTQSRNLFVRYLTHLRYI